MEEDNHIVVTKMSGEKVSFSSMKLRYSLEKSGAGAKDVEDILTTIKAMLYEGISTKEIYAKAFSLLRKKSRANAARYKLKRALLELGPTGYPFEQYVGELLKYQGYDVIVGTIVQGHCIPHEVDVIAKKNNTQLMVECKFHTKQTRHSDVKIPLYIQSRFKDIEKVWAKLPGHEDTFHQGWIVTNTRFTTVALEYGLCAGLQLVGWDYPKHGSLKDRIDIAGLHPITCLTSITNKEKSTLLKRKKVLCKDLCANPQLLFEIGAKESRHAKILAEAEAVCKTNGD